MDEIEQFDRPLFKKLASNDTGAAPGHQGGVLIPKDLDKYFPQLFTHVTQLSPTVDEYITAALFIGNSLQQIVQSRYQYQTWGGTRRPERRLTSNLGAIRHVANAGDYLLIERN